MSEPAETVPANPSEPSPSLLLEDVFFAPLFQALQAPGITRGCGVVDDASFAALAVLRVLENSKTGRDFIQTRSIPTHPGLTRANYFDGLNIQKDSPFVEIFLLFAGRLVAFVHETGAMVGGLAEILGEAGVLPRDFSRGGSALCLWRG